MKRKLAGAVGVPVIAAMLLSGCTGNPEDQSKGVPGDSKSSTFIAVYPAVSDNIDPNIYLGDSSRRFGFERAGTLFTYDTGNLAGNGCEQLASGDDLVGSLAESWTYSKEDSAYIVKLRAATSQFGNELTSEDVKFTFDRFKAEPGISASIMKIIHPAEDFVKVIDEKTFQFRVEQPSTIDLPIMTWPSFQILDSKAVKEHATDSDAWATDWLSKNTATYGPWTVTEADFQPGTQITLHQNKNFWGERGDVDTLVMRAVPDSGTRVQLLQTGGAQYADTLSYDQIAQVESDDAVTVALCTSANIDAIALNHADPVIAKPEVRKAISLAVDRQKLVEGPYRNFAKASESAVTSAFYPDASKNLSYDPEKAKKLLAEAGYPDGLTLSLAYSPARPGPEVEQTAILVQNQLAKVGITVTLEPIAASSQFEQATRDGKLQMWLNVLPPAIPDIAYNGALYYLSDGAQNYFNFASDELDALIDKTGDPAEADNVEALMSQMSELLGEEIPTIPLVERSFIKAVSSDYTGFANQPSGELFVYKLKLK